MEAARGAESLIDKINPPRLEDAGLEDCSLPPESIKEAFLRAASAVRSIVPDSDDEGQCVEGLWEDSTDALVGISDCVSAPSKGYFVVGPTETPGDKLVVGGDAEVKVDAVVRAGLPEGGDACINSKGIDILGKKLRGKDDVANQEENGENKSTIA